jgi:hypothetical protein
MAEKTFKFSVLLEGGETVPVTAGSPAEAIAEVKQTHPGQQVLKCSRIRK